MHFADSHAHLEDEHFQTDKDAVWKRAQDTGISCLIDVGSDLESSERAVKTAEAVSGIWAAVGISPHDAVDANASALCRLRELAANKSVVAIGETGLDFYRRLAPEAAQMAAFEAHLALAAEMHKAVIVHSRAAEPQVLSYINRYSSRVTIIWHCFSADVETMRQAVELGCYISLAAPVTYPRAQALRVAAAAVPISRLLLETDCPYLPPEGKRGQRNEPANLVDTARVVAALREMELSELAENTYMNAEVAFGLGAKNCRE